MYRIGRRAGKQIIQNGKNKVDELIDGAKTAYKKPETYLDFGLDTADAVASYYGFPVPLNVFRSRDMWKTLDSSSKQIDAIYGQIKTEGIIKTAKQQALERGPQLGDTVVDGFSSSVGKVRALFGFAKKHDSTIVDRTTNESARLGTNGKKVVVDRVTRAGSGAAQVWYAHDVYSGKGNKTTVHPANLSSRGAVADQSRLRWTVVLLPLPL